ncbi:hypothetical protein [[Eubacterium] hominis]|uniref:hypothetical protein n=1 Tax=[Eubacterium] hominis TaxID=2764325 RepID=UPI0022E15231
MRKILIAIVSLLVITNMYGCSSTHKSTEKSGITTSDNAEKILNSNQWGNVFEEQLKNLKIDDISEIDVQQNSSDNAKGVLITASTKIMFELRNDDKDGWLLISLIDQNDTDKYYYTDSCKNSEFCYDDIYDYKTSKLIKTEKSDNSTTPDKDSLKKSTEEMMKNYDVIDISILTRSAGDGYIISVQINSSDNADVLADEISNKLSSINKFYQIEIDNNGKLVLSKDQSDF